jgi:hypothetical protein
MFDHFSQSTEHAGQAFELNRHRSIAREVAYSARLWAISLKLGAVLRRCKYSSIGLDQILYQTLLEAFF